MLNMNKLIVVMLGAIVFLAAAQGNAAAFLLVDQSTDLYTTNVGTYTAVAGAPNSGQGNVGNLFSVTTAENGTTLSKSVTMGALVDILKGGSAPLSSTNVLVFGLDIDETGSAGTNSLDINTLTMTFNNTPTGIKTYGLGSEAIRGTNYGPGNSEGEVLFQVDLGFDFLARYTSTSTDLLNFSVKLTDGDNGQDRFFLSSGFSANPPVPPVTNAVPEPISILLLGSGLSALAFVRKLK
jgi:hypothetical protein